MESGCSRPVFGNSSAEGEFAYLFIDITRVFVYWSVTSNDQGGWVH